MKRLILAMFLVVATVSLIAQTTITKGPVDATMKVAWTMPDGIALADSATYDPILRDSVNNFTLVLTNNSCLVPAGTATVNCVSPLTPTLITQLNAMGTHSLTLTLRNATGETSPSIPFTLATLPAAPTNFKIIK